MSFIVESSSEFRLRDRKRERERIVLISSSSSKLVGQLTSFAPGHAASPLLCAGCGDRAWSLRHSAAVLLEMIKIFKNSMLLVCFFCGSKTLLCCGDRVRWRRHSAAKSNVYCMLFSFGLLGASWGIRGCLSGALGNIMGMSVASLRPFLAPWGGPLTPWLALVSLD